VMRFLGPLQILKTINIPTSANADPTAIRDMVVVERR